MRTAFSTEQLSDPHMKAAETSFRACVHCGFCTATCPTYVLLGDERDSPRGRIALMQRMLESDATPSADAVKHIDRCLSCLGCRSTCPSNVDYADLIDTARAHIAQKFRRPVSEKLFRETVLFLLVRPKLFAAALSLGRIFAPIAKALPGRLGAMVRKIPAKRILSLKQKETLTPKMATRRVALLPGCVQRVLAPEIDLAAARVLARQGTQTIPLENSGCCGALALHMGKKDTALTQTRALMDCVDKDFGLHGAILNTASGCSAFLKDYPRMFAGEADCERAKSFAARVVDFSEVAIPQAPELPLPATKVAYHAPCSLQHGQRLSGKGEGLLKAAGLVLCPTVEPHLCCGSAGSYSLLQPEISQALGARKRAALSGGDAEIIVTANIGCLMQLADPNGPPVMHIAEVLDGRHNVEGAGTIKIRRMSSL